MGALVIRPMRPEERPLLTDFLYEAIFVPEGEDPPGREILKRPELQVYVEDFGTRRGDCCMVAEDAGRVIGAAWARVMDDYGHVDDDTPSLAIAIDPAYRGQGVGTAMLSRLLAAVSAEGFNRVSLSVQRANRALRLYQRMGFQVLEDKGDEVIMARFLRRTGEAGE